jgi:hypothetical protein
MENVHCAHSIVGVSSVWQRWNLQSERWFRWDPKDQMQGLFSQKIYDRVCSSMRITVSHRVQLLNSLTVQLDPTSTEGVEKHELMSMRKAQWP